MLLTQPGPHAVETTLEEWRDAPRDRVLPLKIFWPRAANAARPVILFSHGLSGTRQGYGYLGTHWASHGYVAVHLQHPGTDSIVLQDPAGAMEAMKAASKDVRHAINRAQDVRFVIDQLHRPGRLQGDWCHGLDLERIGIAGHSMGAGTALSIAGQSYPAMAEPAPLADRRVKAAVVLSPPVRGTPPQGSWASIYGTVAIPCLHMTGTDDESPIGITTAAQRRIPFDTITTRPQYLVTFRGGDHMVFTGRPRKRSPQHDSAIQAAIRGLSMTFWRAHLDGDPRAHEWLAGPEAAKALADLGTIEVKRVGNLRGS